MLVNNFVYVNNNTDCKIRTNDIVKPDILCSKTANMAKMIPVMIKRILRIGVSLLNTFNLLFIDPSSFFMPKTAIYHAWTVRVTSTTRNFCHNIHLNYIITYDRIFCHPNSVLFMHIFD